jgi:hypothetical protein
MSLSRFLKGEKMRRGFIQSLALALGVSSVLGWAVGCNNSTEVPLAKVEHVDPPKPPPPDKIRKDQRPTYGASSGMKYNPGGGSPSNPAGN